MLGERIAKLRLEKQMTQEELAKALQISRSALSLYELNKREPDAETLKKIADYFDVTIDFLLGRSDDPKRRDPELEKLLSGYHGIREKVDLTEFFNKVKNLSPSNKAKAIKYISATPAEMVMLPILGDIRAGKPLFADEHLKGQMPFPKEMLSAGYDHFLLKIDGDSMTGDGIEAGDIVLIRVQNYIDYNNQIAAVIINGYEACLKHVIYPEGSDMVILRSSNPSYQDIVHPADDVVINGVYAGIFKAPKK